MFFVIYKNTVLGQSTEHPSVCFEFDPTIVNDVIIVEKDTMTKDDVISRGTLFLDGDVIYADQSPHVYKGVRVATKCDVDRVTQNELTKIFNAYGGEEKFRTEMSLLCSDLISAQEKATLQAKLQPVINARDALINEGNAFAANKSLENVCY